MFRHHSFVLILATTLWIESPGLTQQAAPQQPSSKSSSSSSSSSAKHARKAASTTRAELDAGSVTNGAYRNAELGFTCKVPVGWVLRTEELNESGDPDAKKNASKVLLAAFSRPPAAPGEDVNSSILIAAEPVDSYPGLKEAAQYFDPVAEVARAQGFEVISEPYEFPVGTKAMVRSDFQRDVGTRVMLQSTLVMLSRGYAVSLTFIGGTEDEVEELIEGLKFGAIGKPANTQSKRQ